MKCLIVTPIGPGHQKLAERSAASVRAAFAKNRGVFTEFEIQAVDDTQGLIGRSAARNQAVRQAEQRGADWVFFLDADDLMVPDAFANAAPYMKDRDAIWGEIYEVEAGQSTPPVRRARQISPIDNLVQVLVNDPFLTLQMGHFVRSAVALANPFDERLEVGEDFDYYLRVWRQVKCIKIAAPLFINVRGHHSQGPRAGTGNDWRSAVTDVFAKFCAENRLVAQVPYGSRKVRFRIGNTLDLVQSYLVHDKFFEENELLELLPCIPKRARVLDVGSNIGNHALFLMCCAEAQLVHCFEPAPITATLLEENFQLNGIAPERYLVRRMGVGALKQRASLCLAGADNSGANSLKPAEAGEVEVDSLDNLYPSEQFDCLKIDVEGMELAVLAGAGNLIERCRPTILIEVSNANKECFFAWVSSAGYRIHRVFEMVYASNYLLLPQQARSGFFEQGAVSQMPFKGRVGLAPGQSPAGWSQIRFIEEYLKGAPHLELIRMEAKGWALRDMEQRRLEPVELSSLAGAMEAAGIETLVLGEGLDRLCLEELSDALAQAFQASRRVVLLTLMDARWENTFGQERHYWDAESYLVQAGRFGFSLVHYLKLPHKTAYRLDEQLESRLTLLDLRAGK